MTRLEQRPADQTRERRPTISVVVCTCGRAGPLRCCIDAVVAQTHLPDEVIVVDDGERLGDALSPLGEIVRDRGVPWRVMSKRDPGLTSARNLALRHARSEVVQFFDDDAEPEPDYLAKVLDLLADDADGAIAVLGGHVIEPRLMTRGGKLWEVASRLAGWWRIGRRSLRRPSPDERVWLAGRFEPTTNLIGAAMAVRRDAVYPPGFDEALTGYALGEDREVALRMARTHLVGIVQSARAVHRTASGGRPDPVRYGYASAYNYCYIAAKNLPMGVGDWLVVAWGLGVLFALRVAWAVAARSGNHLLEAWGLLRGVVAWLAKPTDRIDCCS